MALPSIKVVGRLGVTVPDTVDLDDEPEITWCDEGEVWLTPTLTYAQWIEGEPLAPALGNSVTKLVVDAEGYLTYRGLRYTTVFDLTSAQLNPHVGPGKATHNVAFKAVKCNGVEVRFPDGPARLASDTIDPDEGAVNILRQMPIPTAGGVPIIVGPPGASTYDLAVNAGYVGTLEEWLADVESDRVAAEAARTAAQAASSAAVTAKTAAETASSTATTAASAASGSATAAGTARTGAETARTAAEAAKAAAEADRTAAQTARTGAETARDTAVTARTGAETAQTGAQTAKTAAEAARDVALTAPFGGTALTTQNLNDVVTPGVYYVAAANSTIEKNYPKAAIDAVLTVTRSEAGRVSQVIRAITGAGAPSPVQWSRRLSASTWGIWAYTPSMDTTGGEVKVWDPTASANRSLLVTNIAINTEDLNTVIAPGVYSQFTSANVTPAKNYPTLNASQEKRGRVTVAMWGTAPWAVSQEYATLGNATMPSLVFQRAQVLSGTWTPWRLISNYQRVSEAAGRAVYAWDDLNNREQLIYGDTGTRSIGALLGVTAGAIYLRRMTNSVELVAVDAAFGNTSAGTIDLPALPDGFWPVANANALMLFTAASGRVLVLTNGVVRLFAFPANGVLNGTMSFSTVRTYPTVLPGSLTSSPPFN